MLYVGYLDFRACLAFLFSLMDFVGFFLASFLTSLDFAITDLVFNMQNIENSSVGGLYLTLA